MIDPVEKVRCEFPKAHPHATKEPCAKGFWIVSGTGYTLAWAWTEADAWVASAKLLVAAEAQKWRELTQC